MRQAYSFDQIDWEASLPEQISNWLAELFLLRGVPFRYLVAEESMLPPDSIRFFRLDPGWLAALADGALSLGQRTSADRAADEAARPLLLRTTRAALPGRRMKLMHPNHRRTADTALPEAPLSGFLLRCELVRCWKGIEVQGYQGEKSCLVLRMEALDDDLLLCLFSGAIDRVVFLEPGEALHFGAKDGKVSLRKIAGEIGEYTGKSIPLPVEASGRVRVGELAEKVSGELGGAVSSAELALQLFCTADRCKIERK